MQQTAASTATASKSAPTTSPTISSGSGAPAAAHRAITFLIVRYFSEKCAWDRTSQTLARAHPHPRNPRRQPQAAVLLQHLRAKEWRSPVRRRQPLRLHPQPRPSPQVRLLQQLPQLRLYQKHQRAPRPLLLQLRRLQPQPLRQAQVQLEQRARRHGRSRQPVYRQCILPRGTMCIFMRRAASILIQTCRRTVSCTKNEGSPESVLQRRCNFRVPMRHRKAGRSFPRTMQNVLWLI
jgi:hypothetical protein